MDSTVSEAKDAMSLALHEYRNRSEIKTTLVYSPSPSDPHKFIELAILDESDQYCLYYGSACLEPGDFANCGAPQKKNP